MERYFLSDKPVSSYTPSSQEKVVMIVQARMSSTRLPGKVLKEILGRPLLSYMIERLRRVKLASILIATSTEPSDDPIVSLCDKDGVGVFRGSLEDVLDRYYKASHASHADIVVRLTSDCPLIDPEIIDHMIACFMEHYDCLDYLSNVIERTFPRGLDCEIMAQSALEEAHFAACDPQDREHVTRFILHHPDRFTLANFADRTNNSRYRLTVDTIEDFRLIDECIKRLYPENPQFTLQDVLQLLHSHPELVEINAQVKQR